MLPVWIIRHLPNLRNIMNTNDIIAIFLTALGVLIAFFAWRYPKKTEHKKDNISRPLPNPMKSAPQPFAPPTKEDEDSENIDQIISQVLKAIHPKHMFNAIDNEMIITMEKWIKVILIYVPTISLVMIIIVLLRFFGVFSLVWFPSFWYALGFLIIGFTVATVMLFIIIFMLNQGQRQHISYASRELRKLKYTTLKLLQLEIYKAPFSSRGRLINSSWLLSSYHAYILSDISKEVSRLIDKKRP